RPPGGDERAVGASSNRGEGAAELGGLPGVGRRDAGTRPRCRSGASDGGDRDVPAARPADRRGALPDGPGPVAGCHWLGRNRRRRARPEAAVGMRSNRLPCFDGGVTEATSHARKATLDGSAIPLTWTVRGSEMGKRPPAAVSQPATISPSTRRTDLATPGST